MTKNARQLEDEIQQALAGDRRSLEHRLTLAESALLAIRPGSGGLTGREKALRRQDLTEERDEIKRQLAGQPPSLPRWSAKRGWHGGDRKTLYLFTGPTGISKVYAGDNLPNVSNQATVRIATRAEAEDMWQNPLHAGWRVTG